MLRKKQEEEQTALIITQDIVEEINNFFEYYKKGLDLSKNYININLDELKMICPSVSMILEENPRTIIFALKEGLEKILPKKHKEIRLTNLNNPIDIHKLRVNDIGKVYNIKGIIKRLTKIIPRTTCIKYECTSCGTITSLLQDKKKREKPRKCFCGKASNFNIIGEETINIQELNLEEIQENLEGKQPQQIRVYLEESLTDNSLCSRLQPGKHVEIIGIIEKLPVFMTSKDEELNLSEFMLHANNISPLESDDDLIITEEDEIRIKEISANNPLKSLSQSLVPEVYGNDIVKQAIVLQIVKAVPKPKSDGTFTREDINILLCGDVGISKSVTMRATAIRTPNSKFVVGTKTSKTALGAMAVHDELTDSWSLQIGPLVMASGSVLCIDEIDKMYKEHLNDLLEPMSMSTVTVAKAGINASLPAKTSILAAANPIYGNYDLSQPLAKQIDLPTPILNRFDLIFILIDKPNEEFDSKAVEHIFKSYNKKMEADIPIELFKKYIIYCKKLRPTISPNLVNYVQDFYVTLREKSKESKDVKSIPVNLRNMEAVVKLAEAHAKLRLSETVEVEDLNVAKEIFTFCLKQVGIDEDTGAIDLSRMSEKIPMSKRGKLDRFMLIINELSELNEDIFYSSILDEAKKSGIRSYEVNMFLEELNTKAIIYQPRNGVYKIVKG